MMSQMNVRINEKLRLEGNLALEEIGWSPSRAVRAVWGYAARNRRNPRKLKELQRFLDDAPASGRSQSQPSEAVLRGPQLFEEFCQRLGLDPSRPREATPYEELREEALLERWRERGLL